MTTKTPIKTRFAPSPTGLIHLGNMRTALFNALLAKHHDGIFLLRIEDTDKTRSDERYTEGLQEDLKWLGLDWQEGPGKDLGNGPYWQAQRQAIYDKYYQQLEAMGVAYPCFCTEQQLALSRKVQRASGKPPRYAGTCRRLTKEQIQEKVSQGMPATLRFAVPENQDVVFIDLVRGEQRFKTNDLGDFIIRRMDGTPPFLYCNAIDDAMMGVTHALRGEDHLTNTPRQVLILEALKLPQPNYGHITLIVGPDGSPLSKRHGSRSIQELRAQGFMPEGIINYLARLGHYYEDDSFMNFTQLAAKFSTKNLGKSPARFDESQLLHWQKEAVLHSQKEDLWAWLADQVQDDVPANKRDLFLETMRSNISFPQESAHWAKIFFKSEELPNGHEQKEVLQQAGSEFFAGALEAVNERGADFNAVSDFLKQKLGVKGKALFQPLRVALTGELHGPEMAKIFELLGKEKIVNRICLAMDEAGK